MLSRGALLREPAGYKPASHFLCPNRSLSLGGHQPHRAPLCFQYQVQGIKLLVNFLKHSLPVRFEVNAHLCFKFFFLILQVNLHLFNLFLFVFIVNVNHL